MLRNVSYIVLYSPVELTFDVAFLVAIAALLI
jgi:hypothetical protein